MLKRKIEVKEYHPEYRYTLEEFRLKTFEEGNNSISYEKYDPDTVDGKTWCVFIDNELVSISVVERSHYTGDPDLAARVCRYHILKKFRHSHCGFRMLELQIKWAREQGFKILYWTHDIHNKPLNALYQHKRTMTDPESKPFFDSDWYAGVTLDTRWLFRVSEKSNFLQYVYYIDLQNDNYQWVPNKCATWFEHNGEITLPNDDIIKHSVCSQFLSSRQCG